MAITKQWELSDQAKYCHSLFRLTGGRLLRKTIKEERSVRKNNNSKPQIFTELFVLFLRLHTLSHLVLTTNFKTTITPTIQTGKTPRFTEF